MTADPVRAGEGKPDGPIGGNHGPVRGSQPIQPDLGDVSVQRDPTEPSAAMLRHQPGGDRQPVVQEGGIDTALEPLARIASCRGRTTTNVALTPDGQSLVITESATGTVLLAHWTPPQHP